MSLRMLQVESYGRGSHDYGPSATDPTGKGQGTESPGTRPGWRKRSIARGQSPGLPATIPSSEPIAACRHMSGEERRMAHRKMPPVHGLLQP